MSEGYFGPFGLKEAPFTKEIADADLWVPSSKQCLVDELCQAVSEHASVLLTGEGASRGPHSERHAMRELRLRWPARPGHWRTAVHD